MDIFAFMTDVVNTLAAVDIGYDPAGGWKNVAAARGFDLTFIGMVVVFAGLVILTFVLAYLQASIAKTKDLSTYVLNIGKKKPMKTDAEEGAQPVKARAEMTGDEVAAVCTAVILYHRMHMGERQEILTAKSQLKMLSPWALAGKIHPSKRVR